MSSPTAQALAWSAPLEALEEGQAFVTRGRTVTEADVVAFAGLTGDFHPQHADAVWAASSAFGQRIAHGMLVLSFAVGLVPLHPERVIALRRITDVVFKRPVLFGDTIHVEGKVRAITRVTDDAGLVTCALSVLNQEDKLTCRTAVEMLWRADGAP